MHSEETKLQVYFLRVSMSQVFFLSFFFLCDTMPQVVLQSRTSGLMVHKLGT